MTKPPIRHPALELAINLLRQMINDPDQRYWGTTYIDALSPIIEAFDIETDCTWVIFCYAQPKSDAEMQKVRQRLIWYVAEQYRKGDYPTGVIPALYGPDCRVVEVEWSPSEEERADHARANEEHDRRMRERLLKRIDEAIADMPEKGETDAS